MSKYGRGSVADRREFFKRALEAEQKPAKPPPRRSYSESDFARRSKEITRVETPRRVLKSETTTSENGEKETDSKSETTGDVFEVKPNSNEANDATVKEEVPKQTEATSNEEASESSTVSKDTVATETEARDTVSMETGPTSPTRREPRVLKKKPLLKRQMSVSSLVLTWCQDVTKEYQGVNIKNFSGSFANGLAFCALIHKFNPDKFDFDVLTPDDRRHNWTLAVETGKSVGIPELFDTDQMLRLKRPEPRSVQCYVQMIFSKYKPKDLDMSNLIIA